MNLLITSLFSLLSLLSFLANAQITNASNLPDYIMTEINSIAVDAGAEFRAEFRGTGTAIVSNELTID